MRTKVLTRWYEKKTQEQEAGCFDEYIPWIKNNINPMHRNAAKNYALR